MELLRFQVFYKNIPVLKKCNITRLMGICCLATLFSCADLRQKEQVNAVDKLLYSLDSLQKTTENRLPDSLNSYRLAMMNTEVRLKNRYVIDTIDRAYARDMNTYKDARNSIGAINKHWVEIKSAFQQERKQLKILKKDIENGWGKRDRYAQYISFEKKNIQALTQRSEELRKKANLVVDAYRLLHPRMVALLGSLEN